MKNLKKIWYLSSVVLFVVIGSVTVSWAQSRDRVTKTVSSRPLNQPAIPDAAEPVSPSISSKPINRPPLIQDIKDAQLEAEGSKVKKTVSSNSLGSSSVIASRSIFNQIVTSAMQRSIFSKLGIPYRYGSTGPYRYDCSGFVWAVFNEAGMNFTRQSARSLWAMSEPVTGDERFRFGTLVFFNSLGHMGIVADENGFYQASSSKGITYSKFQGYWANRIVGFRRLKLGADLPTAPAITDSK